MSVDQKQMRMPQAVITEEMISSMRARVFGRGNAAAKQKSGAAEPQPTPPHPWAEEEVAEIEAQVPAERPRGAEPRYWDEVTVGQDLDVVTKAPICSVHDNVQAAVIALPVRADDLRAGAPAGLRARA